MEEVKEHVNTELHDQWSEDINMCAPEEVASARPHGRLPRQLLDLKIRVGVRQWPEGEEHHARVALGQTLHELMVIGAEKIGIPLLPTTAHPLDYLRCHHAGHAGEWSEPITDLQKALWMAIVDGCSRHFAIEYRLLVQINARWGVAPKADATPRELLESFGLNPAEYSLYPTDSKEPLPPGTPLKLHRGDRFEAQKDGRYGAPSATAERRPTIEDEVALLGLAGLDARLVSDGGQSYAEISSVGVPSPPWSRPAAAILIAIPSTYPASSLDAFYMEESLSHSSGAVPYQQNTVQIGGRSWRLISWHYTLSRPWNPSTDDLATHLSHCRGFFLTRGISQ
jgi:hypothetical protein